MGAQESRAADQPRLTETPHLDGSWYTVPLYALIATATTPVQMGWDNITCLVDEIVDDNCNGVDDDCDGALDEDYVGPTTTCGFGACSVTVNVACVGGVVTAVACVPLQPASSETCGDGIDDDCDGTIDDGC